MDLQDEVTVYLDEGQVVLTCEVHGFLKSTNSPMWLDNYGSLIDMSCPLKYIITHSSLTSKVSALTSDRSRVPSLRSTLTIRQLEEGDEGQYTCMVEGNSTVVSLFIQTRPTTESTSTASVMTCEFMFIE